MSIRVTLEELASEFGVSREPVRQIEVRAFEKVQKAVKSRMAAMERPPAREGVSRGGALSGVDSVLKLIKAGQCPRLFYFCT